MKTKFDLFELLKQETRGLNLPRYTVADKAPETLQDVIRTYQETGALVVWSGASKGTVWGPEAGNWLFRAWHDWCHVKAGAYGTFDRAGEALVFELQRQDAQSTVMQAAVEIEIMGQLRHFETTGQFPTDQLNFFFQSAQVMGLMFR